MLERMLERRLVEVKEFLLDWFTTSSEPVMSFSCRRRHNRFLVQIKCVKRNAFRDRQYISSHDKLFLKTKDR